MSSSVDARVGRLNKAIGPCRELVNATSSKWNSSCEKVFSDFRTCVVHLRKEQDALDKVEHKEEIWQFITKFSRKQPFYHDRTEEVLNILMMSKEWLEAFEEADQNVEDLPEGISDAFTKQLEEVERDPRRTKDALGEDDPKPSEEPRPGERHGEKPKPGERPRDKAGIQDGNPGGPAAPVVAMRPQNLAVVVQRCTKAQVLVDEQKNKWQGINRGLVISVSFSKGANLDAVQYAATFLLKAKLSTTERFEPRSARTAGRRGGGESDSVINICKGGEEQGILVIPQSSIVADIGEDDSLEYGAVVEKAEAEYLYNNFTGALRMTGVELAGSAAGAKQPHIIAAPFGGRQGLELTSGGPFMHAFNF